MNEIICAIAEAQHVNQQRELEEREWEREKEMQKMKVFLCFIRMQKPDESL